MTAPLFVDTNVLVYAYDRSEPGKQARALEVLEQLAGLGGAAISPQVLAELYVSLTRSIRAPLAPAEASERVAFFVRAWRVLPLTGLVTLEAVRGCVQHRMSFWDAQIWATARLNQLELVLSEDLSDGAVIEGVRFVNPFRPTFRLAR